MTKKYNYIDPTTGLGAAANAYETTDITSVVTGKGASLVGVEDPHSVFTATQVEAALYELYLRITSLTPNQAVVTDGSGNLTTSVTTSTELAQLSGVASNVQTQLNAKQAIDATLTALIALSTGLVAKTGAGTLAARTITAGTGVSLTNADGVAGAPNIALNNVLTALAGLGAATGFVTETATATFVKRVLAVASGLTVTNPDGVSGNPTVGLDVVLAGLAALDTTTGLVVESAANTFLKRTLTAGTGMSVSNGTGAAGNPTVALANTAVTPGTYGPPTSITIDAQGRITNYAGGADFPFDPTLYSFMFDDFINSANSGTLGWTASNGGTAASSSTSGSNSDAFNLGEGAVSLATGTTAAGHAALHLGAVMGLGYTSLAQQWRVQVGNLSTIGVEQFVCMLGWGDTPTGANITQTNGVYFSYDLSVSPNWIANTIQGGVGTTSTTSVAVGTTLTKLRIQINNTGSSATFYINGTLAATITTNIPGFLQFAGPIFKIAKSVGTTSRTLLVDYFWQQSIWSSPR